MKTFDHFLDPLTIQQIFQTQLPGIADANLRITDCKLLHSQFYTSIKHAQKARLGFCYQINGIDSKTGSPWQQIFYARARVDGKSQAEFAEATKAALWQPSVGQPVSHLPAHDLTVWAFPNDPQLPHLPQAIDSQQLRHHLPYAALPAGLQTAAAIQTITTEVVHYYPEERCTTRYELAGTSDELQPLQTALYGKTFKNCEGATVYQRLCEGWQYTQSNSARFRVAQPLGYAAAIHTVWLRSETGKPLPQTINPGNVASLMAKVAEGLLALQSSNLPASSEVTLPMLVDEMADKVQKLGHALPKLADGLGERFADLQQSAHRLPPYEPRLTHGDFHIRQLLAAGDEIIFLDFDEFALGDPLRDVANFVVDLHFAVFDPSLVRQMTMHFIAGYRAAADFAVDADRLCWHLRYLFLTKAYRAYRQHKGNLGEIVEDSCRLGDAVCTMIA